MPKSSTIEVRLADSEEVKRVIDKARETATNAHKRAQRLEKALDDLALAGREVSAEWGDDYLPGDKRDRFLAALNRAYEVL